jgi:hypothetical protein
LEVTSGKRHLKRDESENIQQPTFNVHFQVAVAALRQLGRTGSAPGLMEVKPHPARRTSLYRRLASVA